MDEPAVLETAKRRYRDEMNESVTARLERLLLKTRRVASPSQSKGYAKCGVIFYRISQFRLHLPFSFRSSPRQTPCKCD
jgi:hypothetical protein